MSDISAAQNQDAKDPLADQFGRHIDYLRVSVTDRCDLRCSYCIPKGHTAFGEREGVLKAEEFSRLVALFAKLGVRRVRLTGGEPLVRADLSDIAARVSALHGIEDVSLSTNATQLEKYAERLFAAGVRRLNVSLDSLNPEVFARVTGRDCLSDVMRGLDKAATVGFAPIKINMVLEQRTNAEEVGAMVDYCSAHNFVLRLIERMPVGASNTVEYSSLQDIRRGLVETHGLVDAVVPGGGPARYLKSVQGNITVGFITPMSQHFCDTCNRLRLGADGALYTCLDAAGSIPLGVRMRAGASDDELQTLIANAVWNRAKSHEFGKGRDRTIRMMNVTGG